jgi:hypothetical protein
MVNYLSRKFKYENNEYIIFGLLNIKVNSIDESNNGNLIYISVNNFEIKDKNKNINDKYKHLINN